MRRIRHPLVLTLCFGLLMRSLADSAAPEPAPPRPNGFSRAIACMFSLAILAPEKNEGNTGAAATAKAKRALTRFRLETLAVENRVPRDPVLIISDAEVNSPAQSVQVASRIAGIEEDIESGDKAIARARLVTERTQVRRYLEAFRQAHDRLAHLLNSSNDPAKRLIALPLEWGLVAMLVEAVLGSGADLNHGAVIAGVMSIKNALDLYLNRREVFLRENPWEKMLTILDADDPESQWMLVADNYPLLVKLIVEHWTERGTMSEESLRYQIERERGKLSRGLFTNAQEMILSPNFPQYRPFDPRYEQWVNSDVLLYRSPDTGEFELVIAARSSQNPPRNPKRGKWVQDLESAIRQRTAAFLGREPRPIPIPVPGNRRMYRTGEGQ